MRLGRQLDQQCGGRECRGALFINYSIRPQVGELLGLFFCISSNAMSESSLNYHLDLIGSFLHLLSESPSSTPLGTFPLLFHPHRGNAKKQLVRVGEV